MTVERETAGFALPFAAGAILAAHTGNHLYDSNFHISVTIISLLLAACLLFMLTPARQKLPPSATWICMAFLAICTGLFCGVSETIMSISHTESRIISAAGEFCERMKAAIDTMEFDDRRTNAVIKALITGDRSDIPAELTDTFRSSGASHILALSGFHLGIIYLIIRHSLSGFGNTEKALVLRAAVTIILCGFYTLATGAGPSTVRALIFMILRESAILLNRNHSTAQILLASLVIQLAVSPSAADSVSFQLSYAAMAGIAWIYPRLKSFWPVPEKDDRIGWNIMRRIWNSAAMSISCQLPTAPLAWYRFHSFPKHFILTNLLALPLASLIIPASLAALAFHMAGTAPDFMLTITEALISLFINILEIIALM